MRPVLIQPLITEKSMSLAGTGWFTFVVNRESAKQEIARVVEQTFKVHVTDVRTINVKGKTMRTGKKRLLSQAKHWEKAMVQLKTGEKIDLFAVEGKSTK